MHCISAEKEDKHFFPSFKKRRRTYTGIKCLRNKRQCNKEHKRLRDVDLKVLKQFRKNNNHENDDDDGDGKKK